MSRPKILFRPADGWLGDVIPYFRDGTFHVFYIYDDRDRHGAWRGLDWAHATTTDFRAFVEQPVAVPRGAADELDLLCGTGCVMPDARGGHVIYYAGINPSNPERGFPEQVVLRSHSRDLISWSKDPNWVLQADPRWYEPNDWRDPFIYRDASGEWVMLLCARVTDGPSDRRGAIATARSLDMIDWSVGPPLLANGTTRAPECPDLFEEGGDTYLLYSTFSDRFATRYRIGASAAEPWRVPTDDAFDAPDVYAMKSVSDGRRRFLLGWLSTRSSDRDDGHRQWGGDLVVHEVRRRADGTLGVAPVDEMVAQFRVQPVAATPRLGAWLSDGFGWRFDGSGVGFLSFGMMDEACLLDVSLDVTKASEVAVVLRADASLEHGYYLRLEPDRERVVFDRRPHRIFTPFEPDADRAYVKAPDFEIERPLRIGEGPVRVRVIVDGSALIAYVNDVALSTRAYDRLTGEWGVVVAEGTAQVESASIGRLA